MRDAKYRAPDLPIRSLPECTRRHAERALERPGKRFGTFKARPRGGLQHRVVSTGRQVMRRAPQTHQLHIARNRHAHKRSELPVEVKRRKIRHLAQRLHRQVTFKIRVDISEYGVEALCVGGVAWQVRHWMEAPGYALDDRINYSDMPAPSRTC